MTLLACWKKLLKKKPEVGNFRLFIDKYQLKIPFMIIHDSFSDLILIKKIIFLAKEMEDMTLDELDELEDEEEERVLEQYRQQRIAQIKSLQQKSR